MSKTHIQQSASVLDYSGAIAGSDDGVGDSISGSLYCNGYSRLVGGLFLAASLQSASGFQILQSFNSGTNWDYKSASQTLAAGTSSFSFEIFGDAVKVIIGNGSSANTIRTLWRAMPIQSPDLNTRLSASISGGSVIVSSGSVVMTAGSGIVTNQISASISGGSVALLAGANDFGLAHIGTGTCTIGDVNSILTRISASLYSGSVTVLSSAGSDLHAILETSTSSIGTIAGISTRVSASLSSGSVTTLSPAGSDFHVVLESSGSTIGVVEQTAGSNFHVRLETSASSIGDINNILSRVSASLASGSVTILSPAGSDVHVVLETSTSTVGAISSIQGQVSASLSGGSIALLGSTNEIGQIHTGSQISTTVWSTNASMLASASVTSGSFNTLGYSRLTGIVISSASGVAASAISVQQSGDSGSNWDSKYESTISACSGSSFSIEIIGNAALINYVNGLDNAAVFRSMWFLRPI